MKKIFAFIASPNKAKSNTRKLAEMMLDKLTDMWDAGKVGEDLHCEILTAGDVKLNFCKGCWTCMTKGFCPEDENDDMEMLRQKMLEADLIVLGTPVYITSVSGQFKTFLDRLAAFCFKKNLAGKPCVTVATSGESDRQSIHEFISSRVMHLGLKTVANLDTVGFIGVLKDPEEARKNAWKAAEEVFPYLSGEKVVESDDEMEKIFQETKNSMNEFKEFFPALYKYWEEHGLLKLNSYAELLKKIRENE